MDQIRLAAWRMRRANTWAATAAATNASGAATGPPVAPISGFWLMVIGARSRFSARNAISRPNGWSTWSATSKWKTRAPRQNQGRGRVTSASMQRHGPRTSKNKGNASTMWCELINSPFKKQCKLKVHIYCTWNVHIGHKIFVKISIW